jgi:hypothetical protein
VFGNVTGCRVAKVPAATADNKPVSDPQTQAPLRRKLGKGWIALAYAAVLALPAWRFLLPFTCGEKLTLATGVLFFISPVRVLGGWFLSIARPPRTVGCADRGWNPLLVPRSAAHRLQQRVDARVGQRSG